jgi:alkanesulfonate monooxygenase SsuD/methylene tetrahydromethanopterin reductase-like flavin-dependent oxidoreductase (luciferase family)
VSAAVRSAVWLPLFDDLAEPRLIMRVAAAAEEAGWDGLFVWDHVRWREPVEAVADPWTVLAACAAVTERLRLGPMVTPLARRRPAVVARQTASLDRLSGGRLVLGVGLGSDAFGEEYSRFGDEQSLKARAEMTDEALAILRGAWSGETVDHHGAHYVVDGVRFLPRPVQEPGVPVWIAGFPGNRAPRRRAARYDGFFPVNLTHPDELAEAMVDVRVHRADPAGPFDVVAEVEPGQDPAPWVAAGATWCLTAFDPTSAPVTLDRVLGVVADGPY